MADQESPRRVRSALPGAMAEALELVRRHACTGLKVSELARSLAVSERWLRGAFRRHVGRSPAAEIQQVRLREAQRLLRSTDSSVTEISGMVSFTTTAALTNFFRRWTGASPREYRELARCEARPPDKRASPPG